MTEIKLICGNWGTSNLRAFGVSAQGELLTDIETGAGIASLSKAEQETTWFEAIAPLQDHAPKVPHLICGMAGSNLGWLETGYVETPATLVAVSNALRWETRGGIKIGIVPGLSGKSWAGMPERMRGEETEILGAISRFNISDATLCLPGTHTKWVRIKDGKIDQFNTAITGELFAVLSENSILKPSAPQVHSITAFEAGAKLGLSNEGGDLIHRLFATRSQHLAGDLKPGHTAAFLSGLLIGADVRGAMNALSHQRAPIGIIGETALSSRFAHVLALAGAQARFYPSERCVAAGLAALARAGGKL
ncbi:MAG: 2-dehydro-3-deoxygalactonokinase [Pseudomonadota bacterium]